MFPPKSLLRSASWAAAAAAAAALSLSACSSGASGASAAATNSGSGNSNSAAAQAVAKYLKAPSAINQKTPLAAKPPSGKLIMMVGGSLPANTAVFNGIQAAASAVGWRAQRVSGYTEGNPAAYVAALDTALQSHPAAVVMDGGLPEVAWASEIPKYKAAGVAMIPIYAGPPSQPLDDTVITNLGGPNDIGVAGKEVADWVANDANGQAKKVLLFNLPDIPILSSFTSQFQSELKQNCGGCSVTSINGTLTQLSSGTIVPPIVSALQRAHYDYFASSDGEITSALPSALQTSGVTGVKIASEACNSINEKQLLAGEESACTGSPYTVAGWVAMDAELRHLAKMTIPDEDSGLPTQLLTAANKADWKIGESNDVPADYAAQFKKLWLVG